jgi:PAS domain S-box-containing protein
VADRIDGESAYDDLPDAVIVADSDGAVVAVNPAAARILGSPRARLIGQPLGVVLPLVDPQGRDWWECTKPYEGLATRVRQPERLLTLAQPGRDDRDLFVTAGYVRDGDRRVTSVVVCLRDTAARSRYERSGIELLSVVAHELRSPLASIKGFTATLIGKWERFNDEQKLHMLHTINSDADRLTRLISELLDASRIETGRLELHKQVVDLSDLVVREVAGRVAAGEPEERFVTAVNGGLPELWADPDKLVQVLGNIVENALRHGSGTIVITVDPRDDGISIGVVDEGDGIAAEALPRIFTKFWHDARRGGSGLGLFIAKGIVDAHGGSIEAGRAPNGGAAIRFTLPAGAPDFAL